jgi:UDP-glucose 4-epimerase
MKVFVTGGGGFIGSVVTDLLITEGHEVCVYDSFKAGHRAAVRPKAEVVCGDLLDSSRLVEALTESRADAVMHLASEIVVSESYKDPGLHFRTNLSGGIELLEAMRKAGVKGIVFSSSAAVYGEPSEIPLTEDSRMEPISPYGESKLQFETILRWYGEVHGFQHVSLRYFNACGGTERNGEDRPVETHLIPILLDVAEGKRSGFKLYGDDFPTPDGTCVRDYVHVLDIARAHLFVLQTLECASSLAYNLGTGKGSSNREIIESVRRVTGWRIPVETVPRRQGDPAVLVASAKRIENEIGWKPEVTDLDEMIDSAWRWRQAHPGGYEG